MSGIVTRITCYTDIDKLNKTVGAAGTSMQAFHDSCQALAGPVIEALGGLRAVQVIGTARSDERASRVYELYGHHFPDIGDIIAELGFPLVTGWCPGAPMEVEKAHALRAGQEGPPRIGIHIDLRDRKTGEVLEGRTHQGATVYYQAPGFDTRLQLMLSLGGPCVALPGGGGTALEFWRWFQQMQLMRFTDGVERLLILFGEQFWRPTLQQLETMVEFGTISQSELDDIGLIVTSDPQRVREALVGYRSRQQRAGFTLVDSGAA